MSSRYLPQARSVDKGIGDRPATDAAGSDESIGIQSELNRTSMPPIRSSLPLRVISVLPPTFFRSN